MTIEQLIGAGARPQPTAVPERKRILVVDDDPLVLRAYAFALFRSGWDVCSASDGDEAIRCIRAGAFEAIVSDVAMPTMGGLDLLKAVREQDLDVPVILMTGAPELESAVRAVEF